MEELTSLANRRVKQAMELKQRKYRERYGLFVMEGTRSAEDALALSVADVSLFVTIEAMESPRVSRLAERAEAFGWRVFSVTEPIMRKMSSAVHGQGVLAVLPKPARKLFEAPAEPGLYVLLDAVQDPGNVGTILRTAAAAGVKAVLLTEGTTDPYAEKAVQSSMGSILRLPVYERVTTEELDAFLLRTKLPLIGTALLGGKPYREVSCGPDAVVAFGNEGAGLSEEILHRCEERLYIPMAGGVESLNVSVAAGIILFGLKEVRD